jgi:hypothetical protein
MESSYILNLYQQLPDSNKQEVVIFIENLLKKYPHKQPKKSRDGLGIAKGKYNMTDDFDAELIDFRGKTKEDFLIALSQVPDVEPHAYDRL